MKRQFLFLSVLLLAVAAQDGQAATALPRYYAHAAVEDAHGVIAPWYTGQNGQLDYRVRVSAETLKRYPWAGADAAVMAAPHFVYTSMWSIDAEGNIGAPPLNDWMCGDLGQRTVSLINSLADYYRYSGDPAALAFIVLQADYILGYAQTPPDHPWPNFPISVPTKGKPYGACDPNGFLQLDLSADIGAAVLRAYQVAGDARYWDAARHWGDLLAQHADLTPGQAPWPRYANPEQVAWSNESTGSITMILRFLDGLVRLGHRGEGDSVVRARDAGRAYLNDVLLARWTAHDTWGRYYWDWECPVLSLANIWAMEYVMEQRHAFPHWRTDARNILTLIFNRAGVDPASAGEVYSGAWAIPESPSCCGTSLSYGQQLAAAGLAHHAALTGDPWSRELARRAAIQGSYDALDHGAVIDGLTGEAIVAGSWLNIIHPLAMRHFLEILAWQPELFGPCRENHLMRSTAEVVNIVYEKGRISWTTFDAPEQTVAVLRTAFGPEKVLADDETFSPRESLDAPGYTVAPLSNGDCIVAVRHDGRTRVAVEGDDPQEAAKGEQLAFSGAWQDAAFGAKDGAAARVCDTADATMTHAFEGNQVRIIGNVGPDGGLADVFLDGVRQRSGLDCWNPMTREQQVLFARNGLENGPHDIRVVARGAGNPVARGGKVWIAEVQSSSAQGGTGYGSGEGPRTAQRMVFGYAGREDLRDAAGNTWRPATEWIVRLGPGGDSVGTAWWTQPAVETIEGTDSPDLYRYGVHAPEFVVNVTVAPGAYQAVLKFAATRSFDTQRNRVTVRINGNTAADKLDVAAAAGAPNRALDIRRNGITPRNGVIEFRFIGGDKDAGAPGEAFVQAIEVAPEEADAS